MDLMDYRRKIIANSPHLKSASGAVATFSDGEDLPLKSLNVGIEPVQDLHGYDYPWVAGGGVNKIDYLSCIGIGGRNGTDSIFGNNTSISGNQLTINRSYAQGGGLLKGVGVFPMSTGDKVTISGNVTLTNTVRMYVGVGDYDGGGTNVILPVRPSNGKFVVTVTAGSDYAKTGIFLQPESANSSMVVSNVMVALGETEKPYAPYENICPISGWTGAQVVRTGVNVWDEQWEIGSYNAGTSTVQKYTDTTHIRSKNPISVKPNTTYYFMSASKNVHLIVADANGNVLYRSISLNNGTFTTPSNGTFVYFNMAAAYGTTYNDDISINYPSTDHSYHPYSGVNVSIDLGQTVYGGTLNPLTGVLTAYPYYASYNGETLTGRWVSDRDKYVAGTTPTNGAQVVDMSGTGTEIQLTPQQIRSLYGNNTIFADTGNIALEYWAHP